MRTVKLTQPDAWRQIPPGGTLRPWLTDCGSLTARLIAHDCQFNLQRLCQHLVRPHHDERRVLSLRAGELAVVREVILRDGETPLIFAHTVVKPRDLRGAWRGLSRLGARPLAEMLFHDPTVSRMPMEYKQLRAPHNFLSSMQQHLAEEFPNCWARRSVFLKCGRPLLVTEIFLPTILSLHQSELPAA